MASTNWNEEVAWYNQQAQAELGQERPEAVEALERALDLCGEIAQLLRSVADPYLEAYCYAAFEGQGAGWVGRLERDIIEERLHALLDGEEDGDATANG